MNDTSPACSHRHIRCSAANAFYVAGARFALVKSRGFRVDAMAGAEGLRRAGTVKRMMGNVEAYLACCQLGITMASLGLGWVGEPTRSRRCSRRCRTDSVLPDNALHFTSFMVGFLVFSSLHIVVGEQVPKTAGDPASRAGLAMDRVSAPSCSCSHVLAGDRMAACAQRSCGFSASGMARNRRS